MRKAAVCKCPRCGERSLERFATHDYCAHCNYHNVSESGAPYSIPQWAIEALKTVNPKSAVSDFRDKSEQKFFESAV